MSIVKSITNVAVPGKFVISLDFELFWGVHDIFSSEEYGANIYGAHQAIPEILKLFNQYDIEATWAVVGMMAFENIEELRENIPNKLPNYEQKELSPYYLIRHHQFDDIETELLFAPELIRLIEETSGQEIGSHTFSHFYTLEKGHSLDAFAADAKAFLNVMNKKEKRIESIVFPRNQVNQSYLSACRNLEFIAYRGNEKGWVYQIKGKDRQHYIKRGLRFLDMYVNLFGYQTYTLPTASNGLPLNIRGSRQLKPASTSLKWLERRRLKRILNSMTYAAKEGKVYHLWWHPHNFGVQLQQNLAFLTRILEHYHYLKRIYNFQSQNMKELAYEQMTHSDVEEKNYKEF